MSSHGGATDLGVNSIFRARGALWPAKNVPTSPGSPGHTSDPYLAPLHTVMYPYKIYRSCMSDFDFENFWISVVLDS